MITRTLFGVRVSSLPSVDVCVFVSESGVLHLAAPAVAHPRLRWWVCSNLLGLTANDNQWSKDISHISFSRLGLCA